MSKGLSIEEQGATPPNAPAAEISTPRDQWALLGVTRFLLALVVLLRHLGDHSDISRSYVDFVGSSNAVIGFFVISGFSITSSIQKRPEGFFKRRLVRILPIYWICCLIAGAPMLYKFATEGLGDNPMRAGWIGLLGTALMLQGFAVFPFKPIQAAWTLSLDCFYYIFAPVVNRLKTSVLLWMILASAALYCVHNHFSPHGGVFLFDLFGVGAFCNAWAWLVGVVCFRSRGNLKVTVPLCLGVAALYAYWFAGSGRASVFFVLLACLGVAFGHLAKFQEKASSVFFYLGELSYPLYLVHLPFFAVMEAFVLTDKNVKMPVTLAIAGPLLLSVLLYHFVDVPLRKRKFATARVAATT